MKDVKNYRNSVSDPVILDKAARTSRPRRFTNNY